MIATKSHDVRVVSCDDDQGVFLIGHVNCHLNGIREGNGVSESSLCSAAVVTEIYTSS